MQRKMRRFKQSLDMNSIKEILNTTTSGVLSLVGPDGEPYGVPISFVYDGECRIYFHSAKKGHKIECIEADGRCSFCVIAQDLIVPGEFTTYFRSVIAKGTVHKVTDNDEILNALRFLCDKYSPGIDSEAEISRCLSHVAILRLDIDNVTGKQAVELVGNSGFLKNEPSE